MNGHHTAQTAILSAIGDRSRTAAELCELLGNWTRETIKFELRRLARAGLLVKTMEARSGQRDPQFIHWTARFIRRRDPLVALNLIIPKREPARRGVLYCSCCGLPKEPADADQA